MLVRVSGTYCGVYGHFREDTKTVEIKTSKSAPFEVDGALFRRLAAKGILESAGGAKAGQSVKEPERAGIKPENGAVDEARAGKTAEKTAAKAVETAEGMDDVEAVEEAEEVDEIESFDGMSFKELKEIAKDRGVQYRVGMSRAELETEIRNAETEKPPVLMAAMPEMPEMPGIQ